MKVGIIGTGYVGLPTGVGLAELGNEVVCIDREPKKIEALKAGKITLYEDGLEELFHKNVKAGRIKFTTSMKEGIENADLVIIAVGTPPHPVTKEADMKYIHAAATELAEYLQGYTVIATKSTVPVGTGDDIEALISKKNPFADFDVVSLPEFLREGFAVHDFFHPDRIVVGANTEKARKVIKELYKPFVGKTQMLFVKRRSSETIKYASNAFLAIKIHYINEMANFCEKTGADITEVAKGMGLDSRIGPRFLNPGPGYGGSCFPKDTMAMSYMARQNDVDMTLINAAIAGNTKRKQQMAERILEAVKGIENPKIAVLGLAFKDGTDDCRESPAMEIVYNLLEHKANITAYDPKAMGTACQLVGDKISYADDMYACIKDADVLAILTEWNEFKSLDLNLATTLMRHKNIVDCRNLLDSEAVLQSGFKYQGTNVETFEFVAELLNKGVNVSKIYRRVLETTTRTSFELRRIAESRLEFLYDDKAVFTYITLDDEEKVHSETGDHEGIVSIGKCIEGVEVSVFIRELKNGKGWKVSLRSNEYVNVSDVALLFGGGGHPRAAGCNIQGDLQSVKDKIMNEVRACLK